MCPAASVPLDHVEILPAVQISPFEDPADKFADGSFFPYVQERQERRSEQTWIDCECPHLKAFEDLQDFGQLLTELQPF